jgi:HlyD family secretion protein
MCYNRFSECVKESGIVIKKLLIGIVVIAVVVAGVLVVQRRRAVGDEVLDADVRRLRVQQGELVVSVSATGSIVPKSEAHLTFDLPGKVETVWVEVGDALQAGDELAQLDDANLNFQVRQAQAVLDSAQAQLDLLGEGPRPEEIAAAQANLDAAEASLAGAIAQRDQIKAGATWAEISAAKAQIAAAQAQQRVARDTHDKTMECHTYKLPSGKEEKICPGLGTAEEHARFNLHAANEALASAEAQLGQLYAGATLEQLAIASANISTTLAQRDAVQAQLDLLQREPSVYQIAAAQASVDQASVALEMAQAELEKMMLLAPFDGVVTAVNVREGEMTPAALPALTLADMTELQIVVDVDEIDVARIIEGQEVLIRVDALPDETISGRVERIAPAASQVGGVVVYRVTIVLDETDLPLRIGMSATAAITIERLEDVLLVPNWAIRIDRDTGHTFVNLWRGEFIQEVEIEIGVRGEDLSQVLSGLREGDEVVAGQVGGLRSLLNEDE